MRDRRTSKFYVSLICTPISEQRGWVGWYISLLGGSNTYCYVLLLSLWNMRSYLQVNNAVGWGGRDDTALYYSLRGSN